MTASRIEYYSNPLSTASLPPFLSHPPEPPETLYAENGKMADQGSQRDSVGSNNTSLTDSKSPPATTRATNKKRQWMQFKDASQLSASDFLLQNNLAFLADQNHQHSLAIQKLTIAIQELTKKLGAEQGAEQDDE